MTTVLCVPQWQGSASKQAPLLASGAKRTAELLGRTPLCRCRLPTVRATSWKGSAREVLVENLRLTGEALAEIDDFVITVGGDRGVDLAPIAAACARYGDQLTVLWIDAQPDVYGPGDLAPGAFHGMVVRTLLGDGPAALTPAPTLAPAQVILAGVRASGASEREYLNETGLRVYGVDQLERAFDGLSGPTYVHVDLDVLDPTEFGSVCYPEPDGVRVSNLIELISGLDNLVGAAITEHAPAGEDPGEADVVRRLGAALRR